MKIASTFMLACLLAGVAAGQAGSPPAAGAPAPAAAPAGNAADLDAVLKRMDETARTFRSAEADFVWDQYESAVDAHDKQSGKIYFRRSGSQLLMGAHLVSPAEKFVVYSGNLVQLYEPKIDQVTQY